MTIDKAHQTKLFPAKTIRFQDGDRSLQQDEFRTNRF